MNAKQTFKQVVNDFSSKLDLPRSLETIESLDANHMEMARCKSKSDPQYRAISGVLKGFVRGALADKKNAFQTMVLGEASSPRQMRAGPDELDGVPKS